MVTFSPPQNPSYGLSTDTQARIIEAKFGDGYSQRAGDGLNSVDEVVNVVWNQLTEVDAQTIVDFFKARAGFESFDWTPPKELTAKKYIVQAWKRSKPRFGQDSVTAAFRQVHDL